MQAAETDGEVEKPRAVVSLMISHKPMTSKKLQAIVSLMPSRTRWLSTRYVLQMFARRCPSRRRQLVVEHVAWLVVQLVNS